MNYKNLLAAPIQNNAINSWGSGGTTSAPSFLASIIVTVWRTIMILGGLAVLVFLIMGGLAYLTSGGDKNKVDAARDRIMAALIGMTILFITIAFVNYIGPLLGFDLLSLNLPNNLGP